MAKSISVLMQFYQLIENLRMELKQYTYPKNWQRKTFGTSSTVEDQGKKGEMEEFLIEITNFSESRSSQNITHSIREILYKDYEINI